MAVLVDRNRFRRCFLAIVVLALAARLAWALAVPVRPLSDSIVYDHFAWNLATRGAYVWDNGDLTAYWPVGTAFIYSLLFRAVGHNYVWIAMLNVLIGTFSVALTIVVARRWTSSGTALAAGAVYAVWPSQVEFTSVLASELLFNFFVLLSLWATFVAPSKSWALRGVLAGAFLAAAAYIRPTALPLILVLAAALCWSRDVAWRNILRFSAAALVVVVVCVAPWSLRNEYALGAPFLISSNGAPNAWMGNNPESTGSYMPLPVDVSGMTEVERSKVLASRVRQFVLHKPARAASLFFRKIALTHDRETIGISWNEASLGPALGTRGLHVAKVTSTAFWWVVLVLGLAGAATVLMEQQYWGLLHPSIMGWAYFAFVHAATVGADRYHFPSIPFIATLAAVPLSRFLRRRPGPNAGSPI